MINGHTTPIFVENSYERPFSIISKANTYRFFTKKWSPPEIQECENKDLYKRFVTFISSVLLLAMITGLFAYVWYKNYSDQIVLPYYRRGNWVLIAIYCLIVWLFFRAYGGLKLGYLKKTDMFYAQMISMLCVTSAGQLAGIQVMVSPGRYIEMLISQLTINVRYSFMSISLSQKVTDKFSGIWRWIFGFMIIFRCRDGLSPYDLYFVSFSFLCRK